MTDVIFFKNTIISKNNCVCLCVHCLHSFNFLFNRQWQWQITTARLIHPVGPLRRKPLRHGEFSRVELTSDNATLPFERLEPTATPSVKDGLSPEIEENLRWLGCETMQHAASLLRVPHVAVATAQVLYQRFFYVKSFTKHHWEHFAMACINLAAKIEEGPRRIRDVINVFHRIRLDRDNKKITPLILDNSYINQKNQVIKAERRVLKELGFASMSNIPTNL